MRLIYGYCCEKGVVKTKNQDRMFFRFGTINKRHICIAAVCDGVGAFKDSEYASQLAADELDEWFNDKIDARQDEKVNKSKPNRIIFEELKNSLREKLWLTHKKVMDETEARRFNAATTICVILILDNLFCIYNSGDSRAYEVGREMRQLTQDQITEHNGKVVLANCLGCFPGPNFIRTEGKIRKKRVYMLSTDGFYRKMNETDIKTTLRKCKTSEDISAAIGKFYEYAVGCGEKDDSTCVIFKFI